MSPPSSIDPTFRTTEIVPPLERMMDDKGNTDFHNSPWQPGGERAGSARTTPYFTVIEGGPPGALLQLNPKGSWIGRSLDNGVQLIENSISRRHAYFQIDDGSGPTLTDLNSTNGTFLNGTPLPPQCPVPLKNGDRLQFGSVLMVKYAAFDPYEERFQRELFERTVRDGLTGLFKRDHFLDLLNGLIDRNARRGLGTAVLMLDLDHFKRVNDTLGHDVGDAVLREVASLVRSEALGEDIAGRFGGEEFVMGLTAQEPAAARDRAEALRTRLASRTIAAAPGPLRVTTSIGLSYAPPDEPRSAASLIGDADLCLLQAKAKGRNRVVTSPDFLDHPRPARIVEAPADRPTDPLATSFRTIAPATRIIRSHERTLNPSEAHTGPPRNPHPIRSQTVAEKLPPLAVGICSWSLQVHSIPELGRLSRDLGTSYVQIACGDPHHASWDEGDALPEAALASGLTFSGAMLGFPGEDYTTPATIKQTGGFGDPATRPERMERLRWALERTKALRLTDLMLHAGFIPDPGSPDRKGFLDTLAQAASLASDAGITLAFETGQESADLLRLTLDDLKAPNLKVNFDPANMLLYDMGDPIRAVEILAPDIRSVHVKDARRPKSPGAWGEEVPLGEGEVDIRRFLQALKAVGYAGPLMIEREVGNQQERIRDIRHGLDFVRNCLGA